MGTWGPGPFDNDAAADFLGDAAAAPSRSVAKALRDVVKAKAGAYLDVDVGGAAWAACELVAIAFGHGETAEAGDAVLDCAARLAPKQPLRQQAVDALARIADPGASELAALWHEGSDGAAFDAKIRGLRERLEAARQGARPAPRAKPGDVVALSGTVVQVIGPGEVAVMLGTFSDDASALGSVKDGPARRVPAKVNELLRRGRVLGSVAVRKDLKGKKLYAGEAGAMDYFVSAANARGLRMVSYDEARDCDLLRVHGEKELHAVALGNDPRRRVRSPEEREAELLARHADEWAARRKVTTPGPFGDVAQLEKLVGWIEEFGVANAVKGFHDQAAGLTGYGRPNEDSERGSFAFAGLVAVWNGSAAEEMWPAALKRPAPPGGESMERALGAARILIDQVLTRDAALRLIWENGPDRGAELHASVAALRKALS